VEQQVDAMSTDHDATLQPALELPQFVLYVVLGPRHGRGTPVHTPLDTVHAGGSILTALGRTQMHLVLVLGENGVNFRILSLEVSAYLHFA